MAGRDVQRPSFATGTAPRVEPRPVFTRRPDIPECDDDEGLVPLAKSRDEVLGGGGRLRAGPASVRVLSAVDNANLSQSRLTPESVCCGPRTKLIAFEKLHAQPSG